MFKDGEFTISLFSISVISGIVKFTFFSLSFSTGGGSFEFFGVFSKSSFLVNKGGFNFNEFGFVLGKLLFGSFSKSGDLDHKVIEIDLSLCFGFKVGVEEFGEINLKVFEKTDASGKSITIKR